MAVYQSLTLTQVSQDQKSNTSQLRVLWQSTQTGGSYNETPRQATWRYSVNGGTEQSVSVSYTLPYQKTVVIADTLITVPHDETGEASVTVSTVMDTRGDRIGENLQSDTDPAPQHSECLRWGDRRQLPDRREPKISREQS